MKGWRAGGGVFRLTLIGSFDLRLAVALTFYWKLQGRFVAAEVGYAHALDAAATDAPLCARALWGRA